MSDNSEQQMRAQQREMPEPYEGSRPIPWIVILIVAGVFLWAIGYIWFTYRDAPAAFGDHRINADFAVATPKPGEAIDGGQVYTSHCLACHHATGSGLTGVFPPLPGTDWVAGKASTAVQSVSPSVTENLTVRSAETRVRKKS